VSPVCDFETLFHFVLGCRVGGCGRAGVHSRSRAELDRWL